MEIYNHSAELENNNGNSQNECILALRMLKRPIRMIAADDNHEGRGCEDDSCGGWVVFKAPELSYPAIIEAYDRMAFYASHRPRRSTAASLRTACSIWTARRFAAFT